MRLYTGFVMDGHICSHAIMTDHALPYSCYLHFLHPVIFRHVILPSELVKLVPKNHLMTETEWRNLGCQQSPGWVHYMIHDPGNYRKECENVKIQNVHSFVENPDKGG